MPVPYNKLPIGNCADCEEEKRLQYNSPNGRICARCHKRRKPLKKKICAKCGFPGRPALRTKDGIWCEGCYKKYIQLPNAILETCDNCEELKVLHVADPPTCHGCYLQLLYERKPKLCSGCNEMRVIVSKDYNGNPICNRCRQRIYEGPVKTCSRCERLRPVAKYLDRAKKKPICKSCWGKADRARKKTKK